MFYFTVGVIAGVFIPVKYNAMIKDNLFDAYHWIRGPRA